MNIYCVAWTLDGQCNLSAVVVAESEHRAIELVQLSEDESDVQCYYMGVSRPDVREHVVLKESM